MSSFQEIYKTSYSHGLEQIYKLENIDLKSIKKLEVKQDIHAQLFAVSDEYLDELDLGPEHRLWISPSVFEEPIQVLDLNKHSEKCLLDQNIRTLKNLYETDLSQFIYLKGMGQGHIDEMQSKLSRYLDSKPLKRQGKIDFRSWILSLFTNFTPRESFIVLEPYKLEKWITLSPLDLIEVKKIAAERKEEIRTQAKLHFEISQTKVTNRFKEIEASFIKPWVLAREGIANPDELSERLTLKAVDSAASSSSLAFFSDHFETLVPNSLYFANSESEDLFHSVHKKATSYFWNESTVHPFHELYTYMVKELVREFKFLTETKFHRIMELSPTFYLYRKPTGLFVELS